MSMTLSRSFASLAPKSSPISPVVYIAAAAALLLVILSLVFPPASANIDAAQTAALLIGP